MHKIGEKMDEHSNEVSKKLVELQEEMKQMDVRINKGSD